MTLQIGDDPQYPLTTGSVMQAPFFQNASALVASACDICYGVTNATLVDAGVNDSSWKEIWTNLNAVYQVVLSSHELVSQGNTSTFRAAMNWFTYTETGSTDYGTDVCSTLTLLSSSTGDESLSILPTHFQDLSVHRGCDFDNNGLGS